MVVAEEGVDMELEWDLVARERRGKGVRRGCFALSPTRGNHNGSAFFLKKRVETHWYILS